MSEWERQSKGVHSHGFCPGCGAAIVFAEPPHYPELLKCPCGEQWVKIAGKTESVKNQLAVPQSGRLAS